MCGIFGIYHPQKADFIYSMRDSIIHRGPDHSGIYSDDYVAIGNNRLSIIDLSSGNQPIYNEDKSMVIVYNGELFNYRPLRNELISKGHVFTTESDTETILHAYEEWGEKCLSRFNGFFAFAIWNMRSKEIFIARDRLGIKPLYLYESGKSLTFASEAKAILNILPQKPEPDWTSINKFLSYGYVPSPYSPFKNITKMQPGTWIKINQRSRESKSFWEPFYGNSAETNHDFNKIVKDVDALIEESIRLELTSDVPVGLFLSGGLDSSAVAYFAKKLNKNICGYILSFEEATHDESADAKLVANHLKLDYKELKFNRNLLMENFKDVFNILDEPFGDSTVLPLLAISKYTRQDVKVVLTGWGGDELFAGYPTYKAHNYSSLYRKFPSFISKSLIPSVLNRLPVSDKYMSFEFKAKRFIKGMNKSPELQHFDWMGYLDDSFKQNLFKPEIYEQFGDAIEPVRMTSTKMKEKNILDRIQHLDIKFFLEGNGLFQADRMTMAASLEARVPLLNNNLFDYVSALPASVRMPGNNLKAILKKVLEPHIPAHIINKPKKGFGPPSASWIREYFEGTLRKLFSKDNIIENNIFNYNALDSMITAHISRKADHGRNLWALMSLQLWYDRFINGKQVEL